MELFKDDFNAGTLRVNVPGETDNVAPWDSAVVDGPNYATATTEFVFEGSHSALFVGAAGALRLIKDVAAQSGQVNARAYIKIKSKGAGINHLISLQGTVVQRFRIAVDSAGQLLLHWYDGAYHDVASGIYILDGNWHYVEIQLDSDGTLRLFVDDTSPVLLETTLRTDTIPRLSLGAGIGPTAQGTIEYYVDSVILADTYIGPKRNVTVNSSPVIGAMVNLDGVYVGTTPTAPIPVEPGSHTIEVETSVETHVFNHWEDETGATVGTTHILTYTVDSDKTFTAFYLPLRTVIYKSTPILVDAIVDSTSIAPGESITIEDGATITFTATENVEGGLGAG